MIWRLRKISRRMSRLIEIMRMKNPRMRNRRKRLMSYRKRSLMMKRWRMKRRSWSNRRLRPRLNLKLRQRRRVITLMDVRHGRM